MKTIKITEEAHKTLIKIQLKFYEWTGRKLTFSEIIEKFYIEDLSNDKERK